MLALGLSALGWQAATRSVDFPIYHRIASQVLHGSYDIYPPEVYAGTVIPSHGFRYLPVVAFLFIPFAVLPLPLAAGLFFALKLGALAWTGRTLARHAGVEGWDMPLVALLVVAGYAAEELRYGNAHLLVVALMVFAYDRVRAGGVVVPATALALAIATKITPIALLAYFALRGRVGVCLATLAALGGLILMPAPITGWDTNVHLLTGFARYAVQKTEETDNYSLRGALDRLASGGTAVAPPGAAVRGGGTTVTWAWLAILAAVGVATLAVLWRPPPDARSALLELAVVLVVILIASPHSQRRYFVQLIVPAVALLGLMRADDARLGRLARTGLAVTAAAGTVLPLAFGGRRLALAYEATAPYFWSAAVLLVVLLQALMVLKRCAIDAPHGGTR